MLLLGGSIRTKQKDHYQHQPKDKHCKQDKKYKVSEGIRQLRHMQVSTILKYNNQLQYFKNFHHHKNYHYKHQELAIDKKRTTSQTSIKKSIPTTIATATPTSTFTTPNTTTTTTTTIYTKAITKTINLKKRTIS